ncbi:methyltransferase domain-containing protein [uncultured Roseobacter sp.]|uniref:methyltransferase domain-containing protein n=1 Tax=uncultured Roseobacter sp. TaxID=114847 RepID=UPI0026148CDD|nr:methyltransferase domain-containing protein [uncultured Roseobacter sp.]
MTTANELTSTRALALHRARAARADLFLQDQAADEVQDRLSLVNRTFTRIAVVTPFAEVWADRLPGARIVPDDDTLDLEPGQYDLVIHALSLHWANDPVGQLIQCRRALMSDGLLIAASLGGRTLEELRACLGEAEIAVSGGLSPRVAPMGEIRDLGALLQRAGLALPVADSVTLNAEYRDAWHLMHDLRAMGETNALSQRLRHTPPRALFRQTAQLYQANFPTEADRVRATFEIVFLTGWAPDDSQQKPLRPGSAKQRLADALQVPEQELPD